MEVHLLYLYVRYQNEPYRVCKMGLSLSTPYARITKIDPTTFEPLIPTETVRVHLRDVTIIPSNDHPF
jgi:hypothetical protein